MAKAKGKMFDRTKFTGAFCVPFIVGFKVYIHIHFICLRGKVGGVKIDLLILLVFESYYTEVQNNIQYNYAL